MNEVRKRNSATRGDAGRANSKPTMFFSRGRARSHQINFDKINRTALHALPAILNQLLPGGQIEGREYVALNPRRADRRLGSFKVKLFGPSAGRWADFATGDKGGDPVSLVAYIEGVSQTEAARRLARMLGLGAERARHG
jgi:hypothetical protein